MDFTPLLNPTTSTGSKRSVVVPSPSWPAPFSPQHFTPPAEVNAQEWDMLTETATTP
jgi:hypothetical protein